jgi:hypothetical protein
MSDKIEKKLTNPKFADALEFGYSFGKFSRIKDRQFALTFDEKNNEDGFYYKVKEDKSNKNQFIVRILRPNPEGILLALWKTGKISVLALHGNNKPIFLEIKKN